VVIEFGRFVQEEHPIMGHGDLSGSGIGASAHQTCCTDRVVRGEERAPVKKGLSPDRLPHTLCTAEASSSSRKVIFGMMEGILLAGMVLPEPGGPISRMLYIV